MKSSVLKKMGEGRLVNYSSKKANFFGLINPR